jgi:EpsI family protein
MIVAALLAMALTPTRLTAATTPKIDLETMIPTQFSDWHQLQELSVTAVSPEVQANLDKIYQQTISRTYINSKGEQIMLSIAYGGDQRDSMQVHKPEVCYPANGFQILQINTGTLHLTQDQRNIPVKRLITQQGERVEPVTYWIKVGDQVAVEGLKWKLAQLKYGLTGRIPDGLLFRISSITTNATQGFAIQSEFVNALLTAIPLESRTQLAGINTSTIQ